MSHTKIVKVNPSNPKEEYLRQAADVLAKGGLVIIPTETVYGIAANGTDKRTIERLYEIKKRPKNKPFSIHIDRKDKIEEFSRDIPVVAYKLIEKYWPGPLTLILKSKENGTIGIRLPDSEIAQKIIALSGVEVVCPSANISGETSPVNFSEAIKDLDGLVDFAIDAGKTKLSSESTIVDVTVEPIRVLREGAIKKIEIETVAKRKNILFVCTGNSCRSVMAERLLKKKMSELGRNDVEVLSAGIMMMGGFGATPETRELLAKEGVDVSAHQSKRVTDEMLNKSDIILVMERLHEERILQINSEARNRLFLLKEFAKIKNSNLDITDPIGKSMEFYHDTFYTIKEAIEKISSLI